MNFTNITKNEENRLAFVFAELYKFFYRKGGVLYFYSTHHKTGVTSLLRHIEKKEINENIQVEFYSANTFSQDYVHSLTSSAYTKNWYEKIRKKTGLFILDDFDELSGKEHILEEITMIAKHIIDNNHGHVIIGSHERVNKITGIPPELLALIEGHSFAIDFGKEK